MSDAPSPSTDALAVETPSPAAAEAAPPAGPRPVRRRETLIVLGLALLLFLPLLGSYSLWDPWEGHYAEVSRRMLEEDDLLFMRWQTENFYSKPPLAFWMMAGGMRAMGVGEDGGYSGELVASHRGEWGIRLPFALFGIAGLTFLWYVIARLHSRRAAYLAAGITATTPLYFFITRQAITDMPSCALLMIILALFALAVLGEDLPLPRWKWRLTPYHLWLAAFLLVVLVQVIYFTANVGGKRWAVAPRRYAPGWLLLLPFYLSAAGVAAWTWWKARSTRQLTMWTFYLLAGVAVLAKGPVAPALAGLTILSYLVITGEWRLLTKVEIPVGLVIAATVCLPWHFAMFLKEGPPWMNEYVQQHILNRAFRGVHGDRGTFDYFLSQLGIGMWPWIAFVPVALAPLALARRAATQREKLRLLFGVWAIVGFFFFSTIQTKFHHYILPAVPALCALIAFWLDDLLDGRVKRPRAAVLVTLAVFAVTALDLIPNQQRLVQLFIYRYDRTIPKGAPFHIDFTTTLAVFAALLAIPLIALLWRRAHRFAVPALCAGAVAFAIFAMDVLMIRATPHYGQRAQHELYYQRRSVHGVDLIYDGLREVASDWGSPRDLEVPCFIPETLKVGDPMTVTYKASGETGSMAGTVSRIGRNAFWIAVSEGERAKIAPLVARAQGAPGPRRRWLEVNADRLISRLYWRGESFYSGGEIWNPRVQDSQAVFHELNDADNKKFTAYLEARKGQGRKYFVVSEKGRISSLRTLLPTKEAQDSVKVEDDLSSFFGLGSFTL